MIPQSLADAQANLLAVPRPVLFIDTCDVVNLLQVVTTVPLAELKAANRLLNALASRPQLCQPVGTCVTAIEYPQKTDATNPVYQKDRVNTKLPPEAVIERIAELDDQIQKLHLIRRELGQPLAAPAILYANLNILDDLRATADLLLDLCWELQRGISSGEPILCRVAVKPTSSLPRPQPTVTRNAEPTEISTRGRHDPCLLPRFVPMGEAMVALVLVDHWLRWRAQCL